MTARLEAAEQYFFGQRLLDVLLDHPRHRPGAHLLVIAARDQPFRLLELFPQNYHEPYYMSYTNEDFSALPISSGLTHIRDVKVFVSKVMVFDKPASRAPAVADAEK